MPDQMQFKGSYTGFMRVAYYAAALCAIGDDAGAYELINQYVPGEELRKSLSETEAEYVDTIMLYINTCIAPESAYQYLKQHRANGFVSDVCEKIWFLKNLSLISFTVSEVQYTLGSGKKTVRLKNFDRASINISAEQFKNLDLTFVSGNTDVSVSYYGDGSGLDKSHKGINITKRADQSQDIYKVVFDIEMPPSASSGSYTIYDRLPSNMRYVPTRTGYLDTWGFSRNIERQLVSVNFFYDTKKGRNLSLGYSAMKVYEAHAELGAAYIGQSYIDGGIWGFSQ